MDLNTSLTNTTIFQQLYIDTSFRHGYGFQVEYSKPYVLSFYFLMLFALEMSWQKWETRGSHSRCSKKSGVSQNSQEKKLCRSFFFNKVAGLRSVKLSKKRLWHKCFRVTFKKFLETLFFIGNLWWLLLINKELPGSWFKVSDYIAHTKRFGGSPKWS